MKFIRLLLAAATGCLAIATINYLRVDRIAQSSTQGRDYMAPHAYYRYGVSPSAIVYDLWGVTGNASAAGALGRFFQFAEDMRARRFDHVYLAYRGNIRFRIGGDEFAEIGRRYAWENPVYLLRTFPEKIETLDGGPAFGRWSGGMLGVLGRQMDDVNELTAEWWLNDELGR